jgi:hypothetical protein
MQKERKKRRGITGNNGNKNTIALPWYGVITAEKTSRSRSPANTAGKIL